MKSHLKFAAAITLILIVQLLPSSRSSTASQDVSPATVAALQGRPIATTAPTNGQVLTWTGSAWAPQTPAAGSSTTLLAAGTLTLSNALTVSKNVTLPAGAVCMVQPNFDPSTLPGLTYWVTWTTSAVTVKVNTAASGTFSYLCSAAV